MEDCLEEVEWKHPYWEIFGGMETPLLEGFFLGGVNTFVRRFFGVDTLLLEDFGGARGLETPLLEDLFFIFLGEDWAGNTPVERLFFGGGRLKHPCWKISGR